MYLFCDNLNQMPIYNYYHWVSVSNAGLLKNANLKLGAVTFLYGPNGSGKSTLLRGLNAFSATLKSFLAGEALTNQSTYFDEYSSEDKDLSVEVSYGKASSHERLVQSLVLTDEKKEELNLFLKHRGDTDGELSVKIVRFHETKKVTIGLFKKSELLFLIDPLTGFLMSGPNIKIGNKNFPEHIEFECGGYIYNPKRNPKGCNFVKHKTNKSFREKSKDIEVIELFFSLTVNLLWHIREFVHVAPLRPILRTGDLFSLNEERVPFTVDPQAISITNSWLSDPEKFGLDQKIVDINYVSEIPSISSGKKADTQYRKFFIHDKKLGLNLPFDKVGTGISQIVPILTSLFTPGENLLYIEQPEVHLHPAMQATLMDAMLEAAIDNDKQIIIETHSETFLLRALRRIREGRFPKNMIPIPHDLDHLDSYLKETPENQSDRDIDSVMVYYFDNKCADPGVKQTTVRQMRLDCQGRLIDDWPGGFFEEGVREVLM